MKRVCILQYRLLHYRTRLFDLLRERLQEVGIELVLLHGEPTPSEAAKKDTAQLNWATPIDQIALRLGGRDLIWQKVSKHLHNADLVVSMQESRIISNYWLQLAWRSRTRKFAFWGHGRNMQSLAPDGLREKWKSLFLRKADWWFAYTTTTVEHLLLNGFPKDRITCLNNAIDVAGLKSDLESLSPEYLAALRDSLHIPEQSQVGLFCGSLYQEKRLDVLAAAADLIRADLPSFHLIVVGDGPMIGFVKELASTREWVHVVGAKFGIEKAAMHAIASLLLCPGALGLQVLDSFVAGLPIVTVRGSLHGPEFAYLVDGQNSLVSPTDDARTLAQMTVSLLRDESRLDAMRRSCIVGSESYTVEQMAERFALGIMGCLTVDTETCGE